jgi:hypothetical protein
MKFIPCNYVGWPVSWIFLQNRSIEMRSTIQWCFYGLDYVSAYACFYETSMLACMTQLWATICGTSFPATNSLFYVILCHSYSIPFYSILLKMTGMLTVEENVRNLVTSR